MNNRKIIFIQAEDTGKMREFLGSIEQSEYTFILLPLNTKILSLKEIKNLLKSIGD